MVLANYALLYYTQQDGWGVGTDIISLMWAYAHIEQYTGRTPTTIIDGKHVMLLNFYMHAHKPILEGDKYIILEYTCTVYMAGAKEKQTRLDGLYA